MALKGFRLQNTFLTILEAPNTGNIDPDTGSNFTEDKTFAVTSLIVCNNSSTDTAYFDMHLVPNGQPIADGTNPGLGNTRVINNLELTAEETFTFDTEKIVLAPGDKLVLFAQPQDGADYQPDPPLGPIYKLTNLGAVLSYLEV